MESIILIGLVSIACYFLSDLIGYRVVALLLLVTVSVIAMVFDIFPVLLAALLSALIWNFFFIEPRYTFHITSGEDALLFLMYFIIALVNAVLTYKIRQVERIAREREEKASMVKLYNTLINSLSHELRTPITTIIGATDNLICDEDSLSEENRKKLLDEISTASIRLNQQVENLLNMSRLESGFIKLKKDWVDVNELVYDVIKRLDHILDFYHVMIDMEESLPLFRLDFGLMEQVIYNLLNNASNYTPAGSLIKITGKCIEGRCVIYVEDNGSGFPEGEAEKAFDKFYRLENTKTGGTGLGLSIVRGFVEAHHGTVQLENRVPCGTKFIIDIPTETSYLNHLQNE